MKTQKKNHWTVPIMLLITVVLIWTVKPCLAEVVDEQAEVLSPVQQRMQKRISIDFRSTPIDDVLRILAKQADVDIVKSPEVIGEVTVVLTDIPLEEALTNILAAHDYGYITTENMIRIMPRNAIIDVREKLVNRIYQINYADVIEVEKALKKFISKQGSLSSNAGTSNIIVIDTESKIEAIDAFIEEIDRKTVQILVEARIYDITSADRLDLGIEWAAGRNTTFDAITGEPTAGRIDPFLRSTFLSGIAQAESATGLLRIGWLNSAIDIDATLSAQQENIEAKLLANPRLLVLDNETAYIKIIREVPYQELSSASVAGGGGQQTTEFREIGVELAVTPHLTREELIRLNLKPSFSVQVDTVAVEGSAVNGQPIVDSREAETTLLIQSGKTVVLGGMRKKETTDELDKVPILGDIPIIGELFKFTGQDTVTSELVIFITPWIIEHPTLTNLETEQFGVTEFDGPDVTYTKAEKKPDPTNK